LGLFSKMNGKFRPISEANGKFRLFFCRRWRDAGEEWCSPAPYSKEDLEQSGVLERDFALGTKVIKLPRFLSCR